MRTFVDTNVLVYAVDESEPAKRERALEVLAERIREGRVVVSTQVLLEFYVTVTRKLGQPKPVAAKGVDRLARWPVVPAGTRLVRSAIELAGTTQLSIWDSMIVAAAGAGACESLLTEDLNAGQTIAGVRIENPFAG